MSAAEHRGPVILGAADGLTIVLGLIVGLVISAQPAAAVWHAALSGGVAELVGMSAGTWLSEDRGRLGPALACGVASLTGCVLPAVPYLVSRGVPALAASVMLIAVAAAAVAWLRPQRGWTSIAQTYGVLAAAAIATALTALA